MGIKKFHDRIFKELEEGEPETEFDPNMEPDWNVECMVCGETPTVPLTGMCGPCTFGEAETIGGNW